MFFLFFPLQIYKMNIFHLYIISFVFFVFLSSYFLTYIVLIQIFSQNETFFVNIFIANVNECKNFIKFAYLKR